MEAATNWIDDMYHRGWWNWHLWPQALYLAWPDGSPRALDLLCVGDNSVVSFSSHCVSTCLCL